MENIDEGLKLTLLIFVFIIALFIILSTATMDAWPANIINSIVLIIIVALPIALASRENTEGKQQRINALKLASFYLSPYDDIWRNLKLSNKHCSLRLGSDGVSISAIEKKPFGEVYRTFKIISSNNYSKQEVWNMLCATFDYRTTYDSLKEYCNILSILIRESKLENNAAPHKNVDKRQYIKSDNTNTEKTDINNASEIEITALPGISIVLSKKIIKKREEIGGFKTIDDVFLFLKLKPHMEKQLRDMICVNKMKGTIQIKRFEERSIDL